MIRTISAFAAAASLAAAPCAAADLGLGRDSGERRSGAVAGLYLSVPFGGARSGRPQAGMGLQMTHDDRSASAPNAPAFRATALDLRLMGDKKPTFYVAGQPMTGDEAQKNNLMGGGGLVTVAVLALAVVGGLVIYNALTDDDDDKCLDPNLCD